jgi:hypothetical protein
VAIASQQKLAGASERQRSENLEDTAEGKKRGEPPDWERLLEQELNTPINGVPHSELLQRSIKAREGETYLPVLSVAVHFLLGARTAIALRTHTTACDYSAVAQKSSEFIGFLDEITYESMRCNAGRGTSQPPNVTSAGQTTLSDQQQLLVVGQEHPPDSYQRGARPAAQSQQQHNQTEVFPCKDGSQGESKKVAVGEGACAGQSGKADAAVPTGVESAAAYRGRPREHDTKRWVRLVLFEELSDRISYVSQVESLMSLYISSMSLI